MSGTQTADRVIQLLSAILQDEGRSSLTLLAGRLALPVSTAHRLAQRLLAAGLIARIGKGRYRGGLALAHGADTTAVLAAAARPHLRQLARHIRRTVHLGVWRGDMVMYLLKESGGGPALFTSEGMELEGYCSAIGKLLLAHLPPPRQAAYLAAGPFVALTARTITDPDRLRGHLTEIEQCGFALDDAEVLEDLYCLAVPLRLGDGEIVAALSVSVPGAQRHQRAALRPLLDACAARIAAALGSG